MERMENSDGVVFYKHGTDPIIAEQAEQIGKLDVIIEEKDSFICKQADYKKALQKIACYGGLCGNDVKRIAIQELERAGQ